MGESQREDNNDHGYRNTYKRSVGETSYRQLNRNNHKKLLTPRW